METLSRLAACTARSRRNGANRRAVPPGAPHRKSQLLRNRTAYCDAGGSTAGGLWRMISGASDSDPPAAPATIITPKQEKLTAKVTGSETPAPGPNPMWRSAQGLTLGKMDEAVIFTGNSNKDLATAITTHLGTQLGKLHLTRFADGEVSLKFLESIRGKDVYLIQPTSTPVNEHLMELLLMISTCRRASAKRITAVIPYYGYARQDRKLSSRVPISAADVARMLQSMGVDRVISVDLHCGQLQGFFGPRVPVDNLEAHIIGLEYFGKKQLQSPVIVSPDAGGVYRARKFQEGLAKLGFDDTGIAMLIKQRHRPNEIESMDLVGSVAGCDAVIVDDMIDTAGTLVQAAYELKKQGAKNVYAFATHGLFNGPAIERIEGSPLVEVVVTDTVNSRAATDRCKKVKRLSIAVLIADGIRRIHQKESLQQLFVDEKGT